MMRTYMERVKIYLRSQYVALQPNLLKEESDLKDKCLLQNISK